nr:hypothetical protein HK105_002862 [Polyrhizophydium stewartii]
MNGSSFGAESAVNSSVLPYNFSTDTSSFVPDQSKFICEAVYVEASDKYMWVCKTQTTAELALWIVGTILALILALLVLAAYLSRHAPEIVNNSKQVGLSVLIVIILSTTSLLQSYKATSTGVQFYIEAASCIGGVVAVFGLLVFPRMLEYLSFGTKKNKQKTKTINRKRRSSSQSSASANITANIKPADDSVIAELRKQHNVFTAQGTHVASQFAQPEVACITLLKLARFPIKEAQFALVKDMTSARASKIASDRTAICEMQFGHHRIHVQFGNLPKQVHAKNREAENEDAGSTDIKIITEIAVSRK